VLTVVVMFVVAWLVERLVLRHLVNQNEATLLMATLGITYVLEGVGQTLFGSDIYKIDVGMPKDPVIMLESVFEGGVLINKEDFIAAAIAAVLVAALTLFFQKTATGRALRAVADDHQAALSVGIPLDRIWVIVWCVAGITALVAGIIWGSKLGVQFSLDGGPARAAGGDPRRPDLGTGRHHRRPDHRCRREALRGLSRPLRRRRHRDLVRLHAGPGVPAVPAAGPVRREDH
jgi:branched-chain amino acid transport system permease protein